MTNSAMSLLLETDRYDREQRSLHARLSPANWHVRIVKDLGKQRYRLLVRNAANSLPINAAKESLGCRLPVRHEWPQTLWTEHQADHVRGLHGSRCTEKKSEETGRRGVRRED